MNAADQTGDADYQAAKVALLVLSATADDVPPEYIRVNGILHSDVGSAAEHLVQLRKPIACKSRTDNRVLVVNCDEPVEEGPATSAVLPPSGLDAIEQALGNGDLTEVLFVVHASQLVVRTEALRVFLRDYAFSFASMMTGRRPFRDERRRGIQRVIEFWRTNPGTYYIEDV